MERGRLWVFWSILSGLGVYIMLYLGLVLGIGTRSDQQTKKDCSKFAIP